MKAAARMMMAVGIGLVLTASAASAADIQYSGFFGNPSVYDLLKPGPEGGAKLRRMKEGVEPQKYDRFMVDSVIFYLADKSDCRGDPSPGDEGTGRSIQPGNRDGLQGQIPDCGRARSECCADYGMLTTKTIDCILLFSATKFLG